MQILILIIVVLLIITFLVNNPIIGALLLGGLIYWIFKSLQKYPRLFKPFKTVTHSSIKKIRKKTAFADTIIAIDCETTGLDPTNDRIISIAAVKYVNGIESDNYFSYINPQMPIPQESKKIHGISNKQLFNEQTADIVILEFLNYIEDDVLVAHNASFDLSFINAEIIRNKLLDIDEGDYIIYNQVFDTLSSSRELLTGNKSYKLQDLGDKYDLFDGRAHDALNDAKACGRLYYILKEKKSANKVAKKHIARNEAGSSLEKDGLIDEAIRTYEINITEESVEAYAYNRLAILYRKKKMYHDELRVLNKAIEVFSRVSDKSSKHEKDLSKFIERVESCQKYIS